MPYMNKSMLLFAKDYTKKPYGLEWRSNTLFIVATVGIGLFTDLFLYGLVVPILPSILRDKVGVSDGNIQSDVSGLLAAYAAASVVTSPFAGILADRLSSRQAPFLVGLLALLMATVLLFVGTTIPVLTIARILQGVSAAFVWTVGLALVLETVGPKNLGKTIGSVCITKSAVYEVARLTVYRSSPSSLWVVFVPRWLAVYYMRRLVILESSALPLHYWPSISSCERW
jgi:MFS family permease